MNGLALCSGVAGLELGVGLAVGPSYRTVCDVEREAYAAATLVSRMEEGSLDPAPIWDDVRTFHAEPFRGSVDLVTAGFPCQPFSTAGKHLGTKDERWIWPDIERIIREARPGLVFLENVPGLLIRGFGEILGPLADLGFDAEWDVFSAAGVGAPHKRRRVFVLARRVSDAERDPLRFLSERGEGSTQAADPGDAIAPDLGQGMADSDGRGQQGERWTQRKLEMPQRDEPDRRHSPERSVGDSGSTGLPERQESDDAQLSAAERAGRIFPPGPNDDWAEWLRVHPGSEPAVCRGPDGVSSRVDRLRALGNGVVPLVAARAFTTLAKRIQGV